MIGLLAALGYPPAEVVDALWEGSAASATAWGFSLNEAVPLVLGAVGFWVALEAGIFNIGVDGQLQVGGLICLAITLAFPGDDALAFFVIPAALVGGALAGGAWAGVAGWLKAYRGANEIISTIMLTFIAFIAVDQTMRGPLQSLDHPFSDQTRLVDEEFRIPPIVAASGIPWTIVIALVLAVAAIWIMRHTDVGLRLRAIGLNREAAEHAPISVRRYWMGGFFASGALCGLAGGLVILGLRFFIAPGWAPLWGLIGITIAFLALSSPFLIPVWGVLFGMLAAAAPVLKGDASVPDSIVEITQTLPVIVVALLYLAGRWLRGARTWRALLTGRSG
jgi:simple sugar transport system permease protein